MVPLSQPECNTMRCSTMIGMVMVFWQPGSWWWQWWCEWQRMVRRLIQRFPKDSIGRYRKFRWSWWWQWWLFEEDAFHGSVSVCWFRSRRYRWYDTDFDNDGVITAGHRPLQWSNPRQSAHCQWSVHRYSVWLARNSRWTTNAAGINLHGNQFRWHWNCYDQCTRMQWLQ